MGTVFIGKICEYVGLTLQLINSYSPTISIAKLFDKKTLRFFGGGLTNSLCPLFLKRMGFALHFTAIDHRPIHVHVRKAGAEAIFDVEDEVELRESQGFKIKDLAKAQQLAEENRDLIIQKWNEHLA